MPIQGRPLYSYSSRPRAKFVMAPPFAFVFCYIMIFTMISRHCIAVAYLPFVDGLIAHASAGEVGHLSYRQTCCRP